jgi:hypothetical protein
MKTILFAAVFAAFTFTACEKNTIELPIQTPIEGDGTSNTPTPPESIAKWVTNHYSDYSIGKTTLTRKFEEVFYNVTITRTTPELDQKVILFDSNGDFMSIQHL